jgi:hypothetical protein
MVMLNCEYCGKEFNPARRFVQKFCSTSCRVLFKRHQGNRISYQARKNQVLLKTAPNTQAKLSETSVNKPLLNQEQMKRKPLPNAYQLIGTFYEEYLGREVSPSEVKTLPLLPELLALKLQTLTTNEQVIIGHIRRILQSIGQRESKNPQQKFRIIMKSEALIQLEKYLKMKKS